MLEAALSAGFCSVGADVVSLGIAPTPLVSFAARTEDFVLGAIISASHNPAPDNGIKLVGHDGRKLPDAAELAIEQLMGAESSERPTGAKVGSITNSASSTEHYLKFLEAIVPERLEGMKVAVDGAHGAAYALGPEIVRRLGAEVVVTGDNPDGLNINAEGGATKPDTIQKLTVQSGCDVGVAFDGDADRAVFSDDKGRLINGDRTIGIWAVHQKKRGALDPTIAVGTVMSNGGFEAYLAWQGVTLERTPVGDKYVAAKITNMNARIGGEQSGHIIFPERGPTGDGLVTMLELLRVLKVENRPASSFYDDYEPWPQLLVNIEVADRNTWKDGSFVQATLARAEADLHGHGRLNVRASGTQPMLRVMVEADKYELRDRVAESIVSALETEAGGKVYSRVDLTHALGD